MPEADGFEGDPRGAQAPPRRPDPRRLRPHRRRDRAPRADARGRRPVPRPSLTTRPSLSAVLLRRMEATLGAHRDKVRMWHSFTRCEIEPARPPDVGVAAATAGLLAKHCRSFLDDAACRGIQVAATEILMNSLEHGCLEISREEKGEALKQGGFDALFASPPRRPEARLADRDGAARDPPRSGWRSPSPIPALASTRTRCPTARIRRRSSTRAGAASWSRAGTSTVAPRLRGRRAHGHPAGKADALRAARASVCYAVQTSTTYGTATVRERSWPSTRTAPWRSRCYGPC